MTYIIYFYHTAPQRTSTVNVRSENVRSDYIHIHKIIIQWKIYYLLSSMCNSCVFNPHRCGVMHTITSIVFILQVEFVAVTGAQSEGVLGIDDILLVTGGCSQVFPDSQCKYGFILSLYPSIFPMRHSVITRSLLYILFKHCHYFILRMYYVPINPPHDLYQGVTLSTLVCVGSALSQA